MALASRFSRWISFGRVGILLILHNRMLSRYVQDRSSIQISRHVSISNIRTQIYPDTRSIEVVLLLLLLVLLLGGELLEDGLLLGAHLLLDALVELDQHLELVAPLHRAERLTP